MTLIGTPQPASSGSAARVAALFSPARPLRPVRADHPAWVIGHRGAAREAPENTIESFARAAELGADGIETDICVTSDGRFVLWHDADPGGDDRARASGRARRARVHAGRSLRSGRRGAARFASSRSTISGATTGTRGGEAASRTSSRATALRTSRSRRSRTSSRGRTARRRIRAPRSRREARGPERRPREGAARARARAGCRAPAARPDLTVHYLSPQREVLEAARRARCRAQPLPPRLAPPRRLRASRRARTARRLGLRHVSMGAGQRFWNEFRAEVASRRRARGAAGSIDAVIVWTINEDRTAPGDDRSRRRRDPDRRPGSAARDRVGEAAGAPRARKETAAASV